VLGWFETKKSSFGSSCFSAFRIRHEAVIDSAPRHHCTVLEDDRNSKYAVSDLTTRRLAFDSWDTSREEDDSSPGQISHLQRNPPASPCFLLRNDSSSIEPPDDYDDEEIKRCRSAITNVLLL
jgi:hypothetical protein